MSDGHDHDQEDASGDGGDDAVVELVGAHSIHSRTSAELAELRILIEGPGFRRNARRARRQEAPRRLNGEEVSVLVQGYRGGLAVYELAAGFGIHRDTVSGVRQREGVRTRRRPLSPSQIERARTLSKGGWSPARIGAEAGCDPSTVWRTLAKIGDRLHRT